MGPQTLIDNQPEGARKSRRTQQTYSGMMTTKVNLYDGEVKYFLNNK